MKQNMRKTPKYFIVEAEALPEVFLKVAQAKGLLETGEVSTVNQAATMVGISRSAFYKYKDTVRPFNDMKNGRIVTFQFSLRDEPGVLSQLLNIFAETGGNILTINQGLPVNDCAVATIAAETSGLQLTLEELLARAAAVPGVIRCEILAG
ncbi:MAG: ACT domain-containing protein [Oscillospiraceae bacterium]